MSGSPAFSLFSVYGIEIEYAIVDRDTLDVRSLAPEALYAAAGDWVGDYDDGDIGWSNELVSHVLELRTNGPVPTLAGVAPQFRESVGRLNGILAEWNAALVPSAMHPWMDPRADTVIWPHEGAEIYQAYDAIFDCRRHGWANVQSTHLNLPFAGEEEFGRLMAASRLVLPLLPAIAASSPIADGKPTGMLNARLEHYRTNSLRIPSMTGGMIPERIFGIDEYMTRVLKPIGDAVKALDPAGVLGGNEWLNARGAIARFDRGAIEIRLIDSQEHPAADLAVAEAVTGVLRALVAETWSSGAAQREIEAEPLAELLMMAARSGPATELPPGNYRQLFGPPGAGARTLGDLWRGLAEATFTGPAELEEPLQVILDRGTLAERILTATGARPDRARLFDVWRELTACLVEGRSFLP